MWLWLVLVSVWIPFSLTLLSKSSWLQIVWICCHPFFLNHLSQFELACHLGFNCFFFLLMCFAIHLGGFSCRVWILCKCAQSCFPLLDKLNVFHALENFAQQISHNSCGVWSNFWDLKFDEMCRQLSKRDAVVWNWSLITLFCAVDARFLIGFVVPLFWYYGTYLFYTERYHDPRERPGLAACAIAVCAHSVSCYILNPITCLQIRTQCMAWPQSCPDVMSEIYSYSILDIVFRGLPIQNIWEDCVQTGVRQFSLFGTWNWRVWV